MIDLSRPSARIVSMCGALACAVASSCANKLSDEDITESDGSAAKSSKPSQTAAEQLDQTETPLPDGIASESGSFMHRGRAGVIETLVNASSETEWQSLDLETGEQTEDKTKWDISLSRFRVRINGGMSGPGSVEVATLMERFDAVTQLPADAAFRGEEPDSTGDSGDADSDPDNAFNSGGDDWFIYNLKTHTLSPRQLTYVIKSTAERYYRLRFVNYYDENGSPGQLTLRWAELPK
jgi:hypothetical protein